MSGAGPSVGDQRLMVTRILWGALTFTVFIYGFILHLTGHGNLNPVREGMDLSLPLALGVMSASVAVVSFVLPARVFRQSAERLARSLKVTDTVNVVMPGEERGFRSAPSSSKVYENGSAALAVAFTAFQTPFILGIALSESIVINGFLLGFLGYGLRFAAPFFAVGLALLLVRFPTKDRVIGMFEAATRVRMPPV
jgi:hypothetical protein